MYASTLDLISTAAIAALIVIGSPSRIGAQSPTGAEAGAQSAAGVVALIDGVPITEAELEVRLSGRLQRLRNDEYAIKRAVVDEIVVERLLAAEAARRKVTVPEMMQSVMTAAETPPSDIELRAVYDMMRDRYASLSEDRAFGQIRMQLTTQRMNRRRMEFVRELKRAARVNVRLQGPRLSIDEGDSPVDGPASAPVTIVEFSDFECPYCGQFAETLKSIRAAYKGRVRFVYRHLPLPIHPNAKKAAELVTCAGKQGLFWPMHDKLFESLRRVQVGDWSALAREVGLDAATLKNCLDSPEASKAWIADQKVAESLGITGTPAVFVNGRLLSGAVPYDTLADIIEDELNRSNPVSP